MNYAYLDKYGILHISSTEQGDRLPTDVPCKGGYPTHDGETVVMYSLDEMYIGNNRNDEGDGRVNSEDYPAIRELYIACKDLKDRLR